MRYTYEDVKNIIESEKDYKLLSENYVDNRTKLQILYEPAEYVFETDLDHWKNRGQRLPKSFIQDMADKHNAYTEKKNADFQKEIDAVYHGEVQLVSNFVTTKQDIKVRHCKCGSEYMVNPRYLLYQNLGCRECYLDSMRKYDTLREVQEEFDKLSPDDKYTILDDLDTKYENKLMKVHVRHEACGHEYFVMIQNFKDNRCPKCAFSNGSKEEKDLADYITSIYDGKCEFHYRFAAKEYEMDVYLPDLKIGFEFCGMYWHSTATRENTNYHLDKMKYFASKGIFVVQIFEDEWVMNNENTKEKIKKIINNEPEVHTEDTIKLDLRWNKCPELNLIEGYELSEILPPSYYNVSSSSRSSKNVRFTDEEVLNHPELKFYKIYDCGYSIYKKIK